MIILEQKILQYISTNLEQPLPEWVEATSYDADVFVMYNNHKFMSIVNNNQGIDPELNTGKWLLMGVDNAYAAIDLHSSTKTVIDDGLTTIELSFDATDLKQIAFGEVEGGILTITEKDSGGGVVKTKDYTIETGSTHPADIKVELLQATTALVEVTLTRNTNNKAFISSMVGGVGVTAGDTEYGVTIDIVDYSIKQTDEYGITTLVRREAREIMTCDIVAPAENIQSIKKTVKSVLGKAVMFIADPEHDSKFDNLIILGYIGEYDIYLNNGVIARSQMRIEEVL